MTQWVKEQEELAFLRKALLDAENEIARLKEIVRETITDSWDMYYKGLDISLEES